MQEKEKSAQRLINIEIRSEKSAKVKKILALFFLFLLIIYPLGKVQTKLLQIRDSEYKWSQSEAQNILLNEISEFKNDLKPQEFLQKFLQKKIIKDKLAKSLIIANSCTSEKQKTLQYQKIFNEIRDLLVQKEIQFKPLFLVLSDGRFGHLNSYFSPEFFKYRKESVFKADVNDLIFLASFMDHFSCEGNLSGTTSRKVHKEIDLFRKKFGTCDDQKSFPKSFYRGILSTFVKETPTPEQVSLYFSDIFNFQNLLYYSLPVNQDKEQLGVITVAYLENQFAFNRIAKPALALKQSQKVNRFYQTSNQQSYSPIPGILQAKEDFRPEGFYSLPKNIQLGAAIELNSIKSKNHAVELVGWASKLAILFFFGIIIHTMIFDLSIPLNLRRKLISIFSIAIFLPSISGVFLYYGINQSQNSVNSNLAQSYLETKLNLIEQSYGEVVNRQILSDLFFKFRLIEDFKRISPSQLKLASYPGVFGNNIFSSLIYNRKGDFFASIQNDRKSKVDLIVLNNSIQALNNMSGLEENKKTREDLNRFSYTMGFAENVMCIFDFARVAGGEAENTPRISNVSSLSRSHFYLLPDTTRKDLRPETIGFFELSPYNKFQDYVRSDRKYPLNYFQSRTDKYSTEIGLGIRDSTKLQREFWLDPSFRRNPALKKLFANAIFMSSPGSSYSESEKDTFYSWRYYGENPLLIVGATSLNQNSFADFFLEIAPFVLVIFSLLALLLVSEIVSGLFLTPIRAISKGVKELSENNDFSLRVEIKNNDEFDFLGECFNSMTRGLMQKKHISRFVSERLISAITNSQSDGLERAAEQKQMTILAADIRNFTSISENNPPETVVESLNEYFTEMESCIKSEGGIIDKFIGDAIIAVFLPETLDNPAENACNAAIKMRLSLKPFNQRCKQKFWDFEIDNGIGIASGEAIAANLGKGIARKDFTIIGNLVETAEKLEALTKSGRHSKIIIDKPTSECVEKKFNLTEAKFADSIQYYEIMGESN